jgi:deoxyribose-phosphate aldolase
MLDDAAIFARVDHTLLSPTATWEGIAALCDEAVRYKTASVCIPPTFIKRVHDSYSLNICTVIGFPLGYSTTEAKRHEITQALADGASELDVVINIGDAKASCFDKITAELSALKKATGNKILKVIVETCYLNENEKIALCKCVTNSGADFIKTSTGFGPGGATIEDIRLFKAHIGPEVKIKASGGMRTREDFIAFINEGCVRLGTSSAVKVLSGGTHNASY